MFGIDFEALILLAVIAFILFGPEKLPEYAAKLGYYLAKLRAASAELTQQAQASFPNPLQPPPAASQPAAVAPPAVAPAAEGLDHYATPLTQSAIELNCPMCGRLVNPDFTFCPQCGHQVQKDPRRHPPFKIPDATSDEDVTS